MAPRYQLKVFISRLVKYFLWAIAGLILAVCLVLVFFNWQSGRREVKTLAEAAPGTGYFVNANNTQIFVQEAGPVSGQVILLIHGTGAWSEVWRDTIIPLANAKFHVFAMDLPPFGYSERLKGVDSYSRENQAKRIIGILDALHIKSVILVGHSVGARPVIEAALEHPEKIQKLILVDPALGFQSNPNEAAHFVQNSPVWIVRTLFSIKSLRNAILATYGSNPLFTKKIFSSFVTQKGSVTDERVAMLQRPLAVANTTDAYGDWLQYLTVSQDSSAATDFANFKKLIMPVYIVWG